jgi:hypothetical protein
MKVKTTLSLKSIFEAFALNWLFAGVGYIAKYFFNTELVVFYVMFLTIIFSGLLVVKIEPTRCYVVIMAIISFVYVGCDVLLAQSLSIGIVLFLGIIQSSCTFVAAMVNSLFKLEQETQNKRKAFSYLKPRRSAYMDCNTYYNKEWSKIKDIELYEDQIEFLNQEIQRLEKN